jgi:hypothetical protein
MLLRYVVSNVTIIDELERIMKETAVVYSYYCPQTYLEGLRKSLETFSKESRRPGWDSNQTLAEY